MSWPLASAWMVDKTKALRRPRIQTIIREVVAQAINACNRYVTFSRFFPHAGRIMRAFDARYDTELQEVAKFFFIAHALPQASQKIQTLIL